jgi:hypothetical protein
MPIDTTEMSLEARQQMIDADVARQKGITLARATAEEQEEQEQEDEEPLEDPDPRTKYVEVLRTQRLYLAGQKAAATRHIDSTPGTFPNPHDRETHIEIEYGLRIAMAFVNTVFHGARPNTVEDCAKRMVKAESGNSAKDKIIDSLRDQLDEANRTIGQLKGNKNR